MLKNAARRNFSELQSESALLTIVFEASFILYEKIRHFVLIRLILL